MNASKKVGIIGGGPVGIGMAARFNEAGIEYDLYESEDNFGGVWYSKAASGRVYPSAHLISPKSITEFPDYPMPKHYPDYPNHRLMLDYIRDYAAHYDVASHTLFNTTVTKLEPTSDNHWQITTDTGECKTYSFVCVCNGLQRKALYPNPPYPGAFDGESMHSMDYKNPDILKGKRVLVVGAGNSGCDIAVNAIPFADTVSLSMRRGYYFQPKYIDGKPTAQWMLELGNKFNSKEETIEYIRQVFKLAGYDGTDFGLESPDYPLDASHPILNSQILYHIGHGDVHARPEIQAFNGLSVQYKDGSEEQIDSIIYATGYNRDFPFLDRSLIEWKDGLPDLFLMVFPKNYDNLFFIGFVNLAGGLGSVVSASSQLISDYIHAQEKNSLGYNAFIKDKQSLDLDLGQDYFIDSFRHRWEVDLWKYLQLSNKYRSLIKKGR